jgi:hypothetical protein
MLYKRKCPMCQKEFETKYSRQNICGFNCRMEANRENSRVSSRRMRDKKRASFDPCEVCGYTVVTEQHHERDGVHHLCPTHHALITRNFVTLESMLNDRLPWI